MTFEDWIKTFPEELDAPSIGFARQVWQAAQAVERERAQGLVGSLTQIAESFDGTKPNCVVAAAAYRMFRIARAAIAKYESTT